MVSLIEVFRIKKSELKMEGVCQCENIAKSWLDSLVASDFKDHIRFYRIIGAEDYEKRWRTSMKPNAKHRRYYGGDKYAPIDKCDVPLVGYAEIENPMSWDQFCAKYDSQPQLKQQRKRGKPARRNDV